VSQSCDNCWGLVLVHNLVSARIRVRRFGLAGTDDSVLCDWRALSCAKDDGVRAKRKIHTSSTALGGAYGDYRDSQATRSRADKTEFP